MRITIQSKQLEKELRRLSGEHGRDINDLAVSLIRAGMDFPEANIRRADAEKKFNLTQEDLKLTDASRIRALKLIDDLNRMISDLRHDVRLLKQRQRAAMDLIYAYTGDELKEV